MAITELARDGVARTPEVRAAVRAYHSRRGDLYEPHGAIRALAALRDTGALVELIPDPDTTVATLALLALTRVAPEHRAIVDALDDPRPDVVGVAIDGAVPMLYRDSTAVHPHTSAGLAARDSALKVARSLRVSRLVGRCFVLSWGEYTPRMELGADSVYTQPPRTIAFLSGPSDFPAFSGYRAKISLANGAAPSVGVGMWEWESGVDSLRAAWSTGFSGVGLSAGWDGEVLRGRVHPFWDFPRERQEAEVRLTPVECRSIDPDRESRY